MASNRTSTVLPIPIGGIPTHSDFLPSTLIMVAYALCALHLVFHLVTDRPGDRTAMLRRLSFPITQWAIFFLRTVHAWASNLGRPTPVNVLVLQELMMSYGYVVLAIEAITLFTTSLVDVIVAEEGSGESIREETRQWFYDLTQWRFYHPAVLLLAMGVILIQWFAEWNNVVVELLRRSSAVAGIALIIAFLASARSASRTLPYLAYMPATAHTVYGVLLITLVIPVYRLTFVNGMTTYILADPLIPTIVAPADSWKIPFYLFHALPELLACVVLQGLVLFPPRSRNGAQDEEKAPVCVGSMGQGYADEKAGYSALEKEKEEGQALLPITHPVSSTVL